MTPYYQADGITVKNQRCETVMDELPDDSVDLILTDPPYFKVKGDWWDQQWEKPAAFVEWIGGLCDQWRRVLKPNGSLYVFASPQMSWHVEGEVRQRFNVLTNIRWRKPPFSTKAEMFDKDDLRSPFPASETIIFAEQFNSDNHALGETDYTSKCDELCGFVFEPLRAYIASECNKAGVTTAQLKAAWMTAKGNKSEMPRHWIERKQFELPTPQNYKWLRGTS